MRTRTFKSIVYSAVMVAAVTITGWHVPVAAQAAPGAKQSSVQRGVTVDVTPMKLGVVDWEFAVVLDTHAEDLKDDLLTSVLLIVDGREFRPSAWVGAPAGGHHREGVLRFHPPGENANTVELRIQRPAEDSPRVFRWNGSALK